MREIKFRSWDLKQKGMIYSPMYEKGFGVVDINASFKKAQEDDFIVMQYTGLEDKNGKEIYEGDIVAGYKGDFIGNVKGIVKYCGLSFVFEGTTDNEKYSITGGRPDNYWRYTITNSEITHLPEIEIIGNIYENPEILNA